jgi:hypothetical protein
MSWSAGERSTQRVRILQQQHRRQDQQSWQLAAQNNEKKGAEFKVKKMGDFDI